METTPSPPSPSRWIWKCLVTAGIYLLAGLAGLLLTQSSGYASPIWPAAGIAVAALMAWGPKCWPGVWLGSLLIHLWLTPSLAGASLGALLAGASTLQALLSAWLARRYLLGSWQSVRDWKLAVFLLVAGPLSCLLAASLGVASLAASGRLATDNLLNEWLLWWGGDSLGVLLLTPLALLLWPGKHAFSSAAGGYRFALPLIVTATLLVIGHLGLAHMESLQASSEARALMGVIGDSAAQDISEVEFPLEGLSHFIAASQVVTREEYRQYTQSFIRNPAIHSVDWAPRVSEARRAEFEASVAREGFPGYRIAELDSQGRMQPAGQRREYFPILFTEPLAAGRAALGLDHAFEGPRRESMAIAREGGKAFASDSIHLARTNRQAILLFVPVRRPAPAAPLSEPDGYVVGVIDVQNLFAPLLAKAAEQQFATRITDITAGAAQRTLLGSLPEQAQLAWQRDLPIGGRTWRLEMAPQTTRWQPGSTPEERLFQGFAMLTAFLATLATLGSAGRHAQISRQVAERTAQLRAELEARNSAERALRASEELRERFFTLSLDLFCIADTDGYLRKVNPAFTRTLGWSEEELLGRSVTEFIHPDDMAASRAELLLLKQGESTIDLENRYRCKDGSWRWLTWNALSQPDGLVFATGHNTTERHRAAQQLGELNAELEQRIAERSQALAELHAKQEEIRAVLDHLLEGVITIDSQGTVQSVNPAIEPLLGYQPQELIGRNVAMLMPAPLNEQLAGNIARYLREGERQILGASREVTGRHKDGHAVSLELSVSGYSVHGERLYIGSLRDIGERKALIASLTQAREDAEQASRAKSAFLAAMSHEIRTPMNGIIGLIDVLAADLLSPQQDDLIKTIRESSANLLAVIDDILDFSKIEAGKLEIEHAPLQLAELVDSLCNSLKPLASSRGVALSHSIAADFPSWVLSDAVRLRQILFNLLGNAIKFSSGRSEQPGKVELHAQLAGNAPCRVSIRVTDNGIGIAPEQLANLFAPFTQAESSTTRRYGGSGLGLAICRRLVELLGGEISATSTPGCGASFTVSLPVEPTVAPGPAPAEHLPAPGGPAERASAVQAASAYRILVVEDDTVNRKVIQQQLALLGYRFEMARNGVEALQMWRLGGYDLVLSDLHMPEMDGYQLTASIRQEEASQRRVPILALTANALHGEAARAQEAGMDDYLTKPIRLATLEAALARWLPREAIGQSAPALATDPAELPPLLDSTALTALVGEDPQLIREILADYADSLRALAGQLRNAFQQQDIDTIDALTHRLKSSSRAVGAVRLGQLCDQAGLAIKNGDVPALVCIGGAFEPLQRATADQIEQLLKEHSQP